MDRKTAPAAEVLLKEESRSFSMDKNRAIQGQILLMEDQKDESVKVWLSAENIRPADPRRYTYKLMLLGLHDGVSLHKVLGNLNVTSRGQIVENFRIYPDNVDGKGHPLKCFFIFMIVAAAVGNIREPYHPVLKGEFSHTYISALCTGKTIHPDQMRPQNDAAHTDNDSTRSDEVHESNKTYNAYYTTFVREMADLHIRQKERCRRTVPFEDEWIADNWRRVDADSLFSMEAGEGVAADTAAILQIPVASRDAAALIRKYGHYIFAYNDEYLLLGVPGINGDEEQPEGGESGFTVWQPIKGSELYGYWLTAIDRKNGSIVGF